MKKVLNLLKKVDYKHYICILITLSFVLCSIFVFPYAFPRLFESVRDFGLSVAYYYTELFGYSGTVQVTVNNASSQPFVMPFGLPETWEEFELLWNNYWTLWASEINFNAFCYEVRNTLYNLCKVILILMPLILLFYVLLDRYFQNENNDYNKDSKALKLLKKLSDVTYLKAKAWVIKFITFVKEHKYYWVVWCLIWALNFNLISIFISFLAFYFYFVVSFNFITLYFQLYKLLCDLSSMLNFVPLFGWVILGFIVFDKIRKKIGYSVLNHCEMKNRGFINSLPLVVMICGSMGKKKTTMITDMALSQEVMFRDKAFEKLLENDLKFPFFPWCNLENVLKVAMHQHIIYNLATIKTFIRYLRSQYELSVEKPKKRLSIKNKIKKQFKFIDFDNLLFDYDVERYGYTCDDGLKIVNVWDIIEIYSQLYFIYVIESSLLITNYSIRVDSVLSDLGNFPLWDNDFFKKDSRLIEAYSRHSHILDFDMLRLGKKVVEDNKNADGFEFGVIVITEIGKERGNNLELIEKKKKEDIANQKNDLFTYHLKLIRHMGTVDNFPFVRIFTDDQRAQSWGANDRDTSLVGYIKENSETRIAMPFFEVEELLYTSLFGKFADLYYKYRYTRADNTVPMYLFKMIVSKVQRYYMGIYNMFGYSVSTLSMQDGTLDGEEKLCKYYLMIIKVLRKRFSTDCFSDLFTEKALRSMLGINDMQEYETEKASFEELLSQNSYFMNDVLLGLTKKDKE